jgi:DNA-binding response OmpR family regulator
MLFVIMGFDVARKIREPKGVKGITIIMFTTLSQEKNMIRGYDVSIDDYIIKLVPLQHLLLKVDKHLE